MPKEMILSKTDFFKNDFDSIQFSHLDNLFSTSNLSYIELENDFPSIKDDFDTLSALIENYFLEEKKKLDNLDSSVQKDAENSFYEQEIRAWYYCYACCKFLEAERERYHENPKHREVIAYQKRAQDIKKIIQGKLESYCGRKNVWHPDNKLDENIEANFNEQEQYQGEKLAVTLRPANVVYQTLKELVEDIRKTLRKTWEDLKDAPLTATKNWISLFNMYRIFWVFLRVTTTSLLHFLREIRVFDAIKQLFNKTVNEKLWIARMERGNILTNFLSVGYYAVRFSMNIAMIIKHTWLVDKSIKDEVNSSWYKRLMAELHKRHNQMLNDGLWGVVNGLTNYAWFFNFSSWFVNYLTIAFLVVDFMLVLEGYFVVTRKKFKDSLARLSLKENQTPIDQLFQLQIDDLKRQWNASFGAMIYQSVAAAIFVGAFTAACFFGTPLMGFVLFGSCVFAIAMYLTSDIANNLFKSILDYRAIGSDKANEEKKENAKKVIRANTKDLLLSILERTLLPIAAIALVVVCWQAAAIALAAYITYKLLMWHKDNHPKNIIEDKPVAPVESLSENSHLDKPSVSHEHGLGAYASISSKPDVIAKQDSKGNIYRDSVGFFSRGTSVHRQNNNEIPEATNSRDSVVSPSIGSASRPATVEQPLTQPRVSTADDLWRMFKQYGQISADESSTKPVDLICQISQSTSPFNEVFQ